MSIRILLVEDNAPDVRLTIEALRETKRIDETVVVPDGVAALNTLRGAEGKEPFTPDLILLDLNMPRMDGREFLAALRSDPSLRHLPVTVLTTSQAEQDVLACYRLGANTYVTKSADLDRFFEVIGQVTNFWFSTAHIPTAEATPGHA